MKLCGLLSLSLPCVPTSCCCCCCCCSFVRLLQTQLAVMWCRAPSFSIWVRLQGYYSTWEKLNPMRVPPRPKPCGGVCVCVCACMVVMTGDSAWLKLVGRDWLVFSFFLTASSGYVFVSLVWERVCVWLRESRKRMGANRQQSGHWILLFCYFWITTWLCRL